MYAPLPPLMGDDDAVCAGRSLFFETYSNRCLLYREFALDQ